MAGDPGFRRKLAIVLDDPFSTIARLAGFTAVSGCAFSSGRLPVRRPARGGKTVTRVDLRAGCVDAILEVADRAQ